MTTPMILIVSPQVGRWHVREAGREDTLALLPTEEDAVSYASALAASRYAHVHVMDERGSLVSQLSFPEPGLPLAVE